EETTEALARQRAALEETVERRAAAEAALQNARADRERVAGDRAARERDLAACEARLRSLEQLEARRATYGDAARLLLADERDAVQHFGAVADHVKVERSFERAVDALLGDMLQHVIVQRVEDAVAGLAFVAAREAGRCGFVVLDELAASGTAPVAPPAPPGAHALADIVRTTGPHGEALRRLLDDAWVVESYDAARALAHVVPGRVATMAGEVLGAPWLVEGGAREDSRGILETRAEIEELRSQAEAVAGAVDALSAELADIDDRVAAQQSTIASLVAGQHSSEKDIVGLE